MSRLKNALALMRGQLWIIPPVMTMALFGLSCVVLAMGNEVPGLEGSDRWWLYSGDAGTARGLVSSLLLGLMTVNEIAASGGACAGGSHAV